MIARPFRFSLHVSACSPRRRAVAPVAAESPPRIPVVMKSAATSLRDLITCDASKVVVSTPSTNLSLPALPNGLTVMNAAISQQGGDIHAYVLASDKKVYHSRRSGSADFGAWKVEQGSGHTMVSALTLSGGAVYSDGATVYASYGGAFGPLPAGVRVAEVRSTGEAGPFVRGTDGILYRWVSKENAWKPLPGSGITAMAASEEDEALAYTDGSVVRYWSSTRGSVALPTLPAGVGVKKLQASAQSGDAYVYALGSDGRVYKTGLRAGGPSFSGWAQLAGAGIVDLSAATSGGGGGEYTDGRTVYATWGGTLPALPAGVTANSVVLGAAADHRTYTYVLAADGRVYRIASDAKSWETLPMTGVHGIFLSQTDARLLSSVD
ncbi:hypothetical protein HR12_02000 [Microbacterium sp. SUBG005]|nr:hypothetical protein HR12_02000 [Microbacterium sp. SUBG005]